MESRQGNSIHPTLPLSNSWQPYACTKPWARPRTGWVKLLPPETHHPRTDNTAGPSPGTQASSTHCLQHPMVQPPFPPPSAPLSPPVLPCACAGACARPCPPWPAGAAAPRAVAMGTGGVRRCGELGGGGMDAHGLSHDSSRFWAILGLFFQIWLTPTEGYSFAEVLSASIRLKPGLLRGATLSWGSAEVAFGE